MSDAQNLLSFGAAATADMLSALGVPGGNSLQKLVDSALEKRRQTAREELVEELRAGFHGSTAFEQADAEPLIGIMMRYRRAAEEGSARDNLRLLAQIIAGLKKHRSLQLDSFARWSRILEEMTRDQLLVAGAAFVHDRDRLAPQPPDEETITFWPSFIAEMKQRGFEEPELRLHCAGLAVHGLLSAASGWGGLVYEPTSWLRELGLLSDIAGAASHKG